MPQVVGRGAVMEKEVEGSDGLDYPPSDHQRGGLISRGRTAHLGNLVPQEW